MTRFFSHIYLSAVDFSFYPQIVRQRFFLTLQYFFLLLFSVSLISTVFNYFIIKESLIRFSVWAGKHLPEITVRAGEAASPVAQPYRAVDGQFLFVLDTTGQVTRLDPQYPHGVLVMKDRLLIQRQGMETQEISLNWVQDFKIDAATVREWKKKAIPLLFPLLFVVVLVGMVLSKTVQAFLFSVIVWAFSNAGQTGLQLRDLFNLSVYTATPAILVGLLVQLLSVDLPYFSLIYFFMYGAFFIGAFMQCRIRTGKEGRPFDDL